jgi:hypothetical protein
MTTHLGNGHELLPTTPDTLAIMAFPDAADLSREHTHPGVLNKLARVARYRRNPRSREYMRHLAANLLPHATVMERNDAMLGDAVARAPHIVLLWPDAIGYGWMPIEHDVFRLKRRDADVYAVSGRRRTFKLTAATLFGVRLRRFAERFWLGEAVMAAGLLVSAPFLVMWDFARGHR